MNKSRYMKITDLPTNDAFTIRGLRCQLMGNSTLLSSQGRIEHQGSNAYRMITEHGIFKFSVSDTQEERKLSDRMKQYSYNLACISGKQKEKDVFFLHIAFFFRGGFKPRFNIVIGEEVKKKLIEKHYANENTFERDVQANFLLTNGSGPCYAVTIGKHNPNQSEEFLPEKSYLQDDKSGGASKDESDIYWEFKQIGNNQKAITLYGKDYLFHVKLNGGDNTSFFYVDSVDTRMHYIPPMALFSGELTFKEKERYVAESIKQELEFTQGYLDVWDKYTSIEGDFLLERARKVGLIHFDQHIDYISGGFQVYPKELSDEQCKYLSEGDELLVSEEVPIYISNKEMNWKDYKAWRDVSVLQCKKDKGKYAILKLVSMNKDGSWNLSCRDNRTFPLGDASLCLWGNMLQIMRRENARERIENGESANPALGLLIEGKLPNQNWGTNWEKQIEPLSAFVKDKLFSGRELRERQREAIRIALNTPDIAVIQGPPGTGKTTVITAIVERLNEISDKRQDNQGKVLLTSFQHDAVRNVIERLRINSLPTPKYGRQGTEDLSQEQGVEQWRRDYAERLKEKNPEIQKTAEQQELFLRHNAYLISPSESNAYRFLEYAQKLNLDNELSKEIDRLITGLMVQENNIDSSLSELLVNLRRLRITKQGFLDDGPEMAETVLDMLRNLKGIPSQSLDVLEKAASFADNDINEDFLRKLSKVRLDLLSHCIPKPRYRIPQQDPNIDAVFNRLQANLRRPSGELGEILYNLLNEIENNTEDTERVIGSYSFAYAATAQQSEGKDIKLAKNVKGNEHPEYDTVIIDEAARVNPGDLIVPMSQAKRRIILVGDHRQLPHIYDEEIFDSMRDEGGKIRKDIITKSMFEYIKEKLKELERADNIPRTITLDAQYRMHPRLGEFINKNFYEPYGEGFESPLGEEHFRQGLSKKPYMWVDFPYRLGKEEKKGISRQRECEADYIVNTIQTYINSEEGKDLTYGVITFYRAQKDMICDKLRRAGLLDKVRVGSVDAFQGMEFDVIFLSVVRTHEGNPKFNERLLEKDISVLDPTCKEYADLQRVGIQYYGRLVSANLLCVALSRQKRLLIVVGDAAIFYNGKWGELAAKCIPAMRNFYKLCERGGMVIYGNA